MNDPVQFWNARYGEDGFAYGQKPNDFLAEVAEQIPAGPVLCLAEGEGRNAVFLAQRGHRVHAVDLAEVGLEKAKALAAECGTQLETTVADLAQFEMGQSAWSGIVAIWMHLPRALRSEVHAKIVAALAPGGVYVVEAYTPRQLAHGTGGPPVVDMLVEPAELIAELKGLDIVRCDEIERTIHEGKYHEGVSAVVQLVARKPV